MSLKREQLELLFSTEADKDPQFALDTSVIPKTGQSDEGLKTALSSRDWVILSGDKGQGKTSYLYLGMRELSTNLLGIYCAFGKEGSKFDIVDDETRESFLCKEFYTKFIDGLEKAIRNRFPKKSKKYHNLFEKLEESLIPISSEHTRKIQRRKGIWAALDVRQKFGSIGIGVNRSSSDETVEKINQKGRPNYEKFRVLLENMLAELDLSGIVVFVDEVNEITLSKTQQAAFFNHLYLGYKIHKSKFCFKVAISGKVEIPAEIAGGNYFEVINLKSFLLHPREYEDFLLEILLARISALKLTRGSSDFFSDSAFHAFALASMGNPRDFFLLAREAIRKNSSRIELTMAHEQIKQLGGEREASVLRKGGPLARIYYNILESLKQRSDEKAGAGSPTGVSYFLISNFDYLTGDVRNLIDVLETSKILYSTGSFKALRRAGEKAEMWVVSYPVCYIKSIRYLDVVKSMIELGLTGGQIISQHRAQIEISPIAESEGSQFQ